MRTLAAISDLVPEILTEGNGAPDMILERCLRNSAIEFFQESEIWQESLEIELIEGTSTYEMMLPANTALVKILFARTDDTELLQTVPTKIFGDKGPAKWYYADGNSIVVKPSDKLRGTLKVRVVVKPVRSSDSAPDDLIEEWFEGIQAGALARCLSMASTPWYEPKRASVYFQQFGQWVEVAQRKARHQNHSRILTTGFSW